MSEEKFKKFTDELGGEVEELLTNEMRAVRGGIAGGSEPCPSCKTACQPGCMAAAVNG